MQERDEYVAGTSKVAFFVIVVLAFAFIALLGLSLWPTRDIRNDTAKSDGAKVERPASPTAGTDKQPVTDKTPAK